MEEIDKLGEELVQTQTREFLDLLETAGLRKYVATLMDALTNAEGDRVATESAEQFLKLMYHSVEQSVRVGHGMALLLAFALLRADEDGYRDTLDYLSTVEVGLAQIKERLEHKLGG